MKKFFVLILSLLLALSSFAGCGNNQKPDIPSNNDTPSNVETPKELFEFEAGDDGMIVTKYLGSDKKVVIPAIVDNKKVVSINDNVFSGNVVIEEIVIPEYVTEVDFNDFKDCDKLHTVTYLASVIECYYDNYSPYLNPRCPKSLKCINFPNAESFSWDFWSLFNDFCHENPNLRFLDLSGVKDIERISLPNNTPDLSITVSEELLNGILSTEGYLYEQYFLPIDVSPEGRSNGVQYCYDSYYCTKEHISFEGKKYHLSDVYFDAGTDAIMVDPDGLFSSYDNRSYKSYRLDYQSHYLVKEQEIPFEQGLKSPETYTVMQTTKKLQYNDYAPDNLDRFGFTGVSKLAAQYIWGKGIDVGEPKFLFAIVENKYYSPHIIILFNVTVDDKTFECAYNLLELDDRVYGDNYTLIARRLVGHTSDPNVAVTSAFDTNSITVNGKLYSCDIYTDNVSQDPTREPSTEPVMPW